MNLFNHVSLMFPNIEPVLFHFCITGFRSFQMFRLQKLNHLQSSFICSLLQSVRGGLQQIKFENKSETIREECIVMEYLSNL